MISRPCQTDGINGVDRSAGKVPESVSWMGAQRLGTSPQTYLITDRTGFQPRIPNELEKENRLISETRGGGDESEAPGITPAWLNMKGLVK